MASAPRDAINLGLGQTNEPVPEVLQRALREAPALVAAPYGANAGEAQLRSLIAGDAGVSDERVIVTVGVEQALSLAILGTLDPGDEVVVPAPGFPVYGNLARMAGAVPVPMRLAAADGFRPTWAALEACLTPRTRMVVLCSPGNPTGATAHPEELSRIARELASRGIPWLSDEIYLGLQYGPQTHGTMLQHGDEGYVASGLSKSHGLAGWRLGWLIVPLAVQQKLVALHQHLVTSAPTVLQQAACAAFGPEGRHALTSLSASLASRRLLAREALASGGWDVASGDGAFYLFVRLPGEEDDLALAERLMHEHGVITIPGRAFGDEGAGYVRVSYAQPEAVLREGLRRMVTAARSRADG